MQSFPFFHNSTNSTILTNFHYLTPLGRITNTRRLKALLWDALATVHSIERNCVTIVNYYDKSVWSAEEIAVENLSVEKNRDCFCSWK